MLKPILRSYHHIELDGMEIAAKEGHYSKHLSKRAYFTKSLLRIARDLLR